MKQNLTAALIFAGLFFLSPGAIAQTDVRGLYNFVSDNPVSIRVESWGTDNWGDTYLLGGFDLAQANLAPCAGRIEVARDFNLWHEVPVLKDFSLHAEYNGTLNMGNSNGLFGISYTVPMESALLRATVSFKTFSGSASSSFPVQLTLMWRAEDLFGVAGLQFRGLAKVWGENTRYWYWDPNPADKYVGRFIVSANPQIWYALGQHINFPGLSIGGELEMFYNAMGRRGFYASPSLGLKIQF